jgi:hypothetical protein
MSGTKAGAMTLGLERLNLYSPQKRLIPVVIPTLLETVSVKLEVSNWRVVEFERETDVFVTLSDPLIVALEHAQPAANES